VFKLKTARFITAVFVGRAVRFLIEGWLAIEFGEDAGGIIRQHGWKVLVAVALIAAVTFTIKVFRARSRSSSRMPVDQAPVDQEPVGPVQ